MNELSKRGWLVGALLAVLSGCADDTEGLNPDLVTNQDGIATLSEHDPLYEGWPTNDKLADEGKADGVYPKTYTELVTLQSRVTSQARRGVCSIFSAVGLMEHLYIAEGTITEPDFSEQFLQWSVKVETGGFPTSEGSSSNYNLRAIHDHGIVEEAQWPYVGRGWDEQDDPACTGDDQPTRCYTHGDPPQEALDAERWHLPRGRWISSRRNSIKAHMTSQQEGVVVGGTFYYQSWNHRASELPTNNSYWRKGYVTFPNAEDQTKSLEDRAGHSFVLVGWDDDLEVQKRDGQGNLVTDDDGNPVMEKGFFLFKNSWGTDSFGVENEHGAGYGWISMDYVEDFLTAYVSGKPDVNLEEICGDEIDNDFNGDIDCDDAACSEAAACTSGGSLLYENNDAVTIPDDDPNGISSSIVVPEGGTISGLKVTVDITHNYKGDLVVKLVRDGGGEVILHDRSGGGEDHIQQTFVVGDFDGEDAAGTWRLEVSDHDRFIDGTLNGWVLEILTGDAGTPISTYENDEDVVIPDDDPMGAFSNIEVGDAGAIESLRVSITIDHTYQGDLTLKLQRIGQPGEIVLQQADAQSGQFGTKSYVVDSVLGEDAAGTWRLVMVDEAAQDEGTLDRWKLELGLAE